MPRHEAYLENPGLAHWDTMEKKRALFDGIVEPKINFRRVSASESVDKKTGRVTYNFSGGPYVKVMSRDGGRFMYTTAEGQRKPFGNVSLFTFTSKMSCASFSIPAGPTKNGTCPASRPENIERDGSYQQYHPAMSEMPHGQIFICDVCYAGKNRYLQYASMSLGQMAKRQWVLDTMEDGSFADRMTEALEMLLDPRIEDFLKSRLVSNRFFRIHDSGDFMKASYYEAWVEVCSRFLGKMGKTDKPLIYFWAPTRMWVYEAFQKLFRDVKPPPNLALRPSALFTSAPPPMIPGLAAGSTSIEGKFGGDVWDCPAYEGAEVASCAGTRCRRCWTMKKQGVNYRTH